MEFKSLCQQCPIQKMCTLPCKIFEVDKCDTYDYAVAKIKESSQTSYKETNEGLEKNNLVCCEKCGWSGSPDKAGFHSLSNSLICPNCSEIRLRPYSGENS